MSSNWASNLDMLAQNGVIGFDAPSYVMGQKPRYVGNPELERPFGEAPLPNAPLLQANKQDTFNPVQADVNNQNKIGSDNSLVKNPSWKKWLFGAVGVTALIVGGVKFKSKIIPWIKSGFGLKKTIQNGAQSPIGGFKGIWSSVVGGVKTAGKAVGSFFKNCWGKFTGMFKSKPSLNKNP